MAAETNLITSADLVKAREIEFTYTLFQKYVILNGNKTNLEKFEKDLKTRKGV